MENKPVDLVISEIWKHSFLALEVHLQLVDTSVREQMSNQVLGDVLT